MSNSIPPYDFYQIKKVEAAASIKIRRIIYCVGDFLLLKLFFFEYLKMSQTSWLQAALFDNYFHLRVQEYLTQNLYWAAAYCSSFASNTRDTLKFKGISTGFKKR